MTNEHLLTAIYLFLKYILIGSRDPGRERNGKGTSRVREEHGSGLGKSRCLPALHRVRRALRRFVLIWKRRGDFLPTLLSTSTCLFLSDALCLSVLESLKLSAFLPWKQGDWGDYTHELSN